MKTIKIIDLLNKIAKDEETPKYVKYYDKLRKTEDKMMCCYNNIIYKLDNTIIDLLDEVEILEEEKKIPKNLYHCAMETDNEETKFLIKNINGLADKINEILDYLESKEK